MLDQHLRLGQVFPLNGGGEKMLEIKCLAASIRIRRCVSVLVIAFSLCEIASAVPPTSKIVTSTSYIFREAPFAECHASTICEAESGLVAAWFGGTEENQPDVGIWMSRFESGKWSIPVEVVNGVQFHQVDGQIKRFACWNPVLVLDPSNRLHLFYKVGPSPSTWWGMVTTSTDSGKNWTPPMRLPEGILGPIKNKGVWKNGRLICPSSTEGPEGWCVHFEQSEPPWTHWTRTESLGGGDVGGAIQPTLITLPNSDLKALCRCDGRADRILESTSTDAGLHWSPLAATTLPNPNSGIDAVTLSDQRQMLVYNHTTRGNPFPSRREMLNVAISKDGQSWFAAAVLEREKETEFSYPAIIQTRDGKVHITYTWNRKRIAHVVLDPEQMNPTVPLTDLNWPEILRDAVDR